MPNCRLGLTKSVAEMSTVQNTTQTLLHTAMFITSELEGLYKKNNITSHLEKHTIRFGEQNIMKAAILFFEMMGTTCLMPEAIKVNNSNKVHTLMVHSPLWISYTYS